MQEAVPSSPLLILYFLKISSSEKSSNFGRKLWFSQNSGFFFAKPPFWPPQSLSTPDISTRNRLVHHPTLPSISNDLQQGFPFQMKQHFSEQIVSPWKYFQFLNNIFSEILQNSKKNRCGDEKYRFSRLQSFCINISWIKSLSKPWFYLLSGVQFAFSNKPWSPVIFHPVLISYRNVLSRKGSFRPGV